MVSGLHRLPAQRRLALRVVGDRVVLGQPGDDRHDPRAKPSAELRRGDLRPLDDVVQHRGGQDVVVGSQVREGRDLERMLDEGRAVLASAAL
jgi:hypothetical protein